MKTAHILAIMALSIFLSGCTSPPGIMGTGGTGYTAKEAYDIALKDAQTWQPDAQLMTLTSYLVSPNGKAASWNAIFHSEKAGQSYGVVIIRGKNTQEGEIGGRSGHEETIKGNWVDSDKITKAFGVKANNFVVLTLMEKIPIQAECSPCWLANDDERFLILDAKTGTVVKEMTQEEAAKEMLGGFGAK